MVSLIFAKSQSISRKHALQNPMTMNSSITWYLTSKVVTSFFLIISISGNGLLAGLSMTRSSVYIDQWTDENAQWPLLEDIKEQLQFNDISR